MYNHSCAGSERTKLERYRSGHNEAVLKTVCPQGRVGSNPTLSVIDLFDKYIVFCSEKYPSWPKGHPWKGCRSLIAARGFKSLLLRFASRFKKRIQKVLKKAVDKK